MSNTYPADQGDAALRFFLQWFGGHYARSTRPGQFARLAPGVTSGTVTVGRQWQLALAIANTLESEATLPFEAARAALEQRLDQAGRSLAVWAPRGAPLPQGEPALSEFMVAVDEAAATEDGRRELRRPVKLYLRRMSTTGSVVTILGGLAAHWAQFTNRVPGSFQLNSSELLRLPASQAERDELAERIVLAAGQPLADDTQVIPADDAWTISDLEGGPSCVLGSPVPETDTQSASLRRTLRELLRGASPVLREKADARALAVVAAATYAEEEKITWALRGMDPALYAGYDLLVVIVDGAVKPLIRAGRSALPWDAPLPGRP